MRVDEFDFDLPEDRIALRPARPRDSARLLWLRSDGGLEDRIVRDAPSLLRRGDLLVFNDTRVIPAALIAQRPARGVDGVAVQVRLNLIERKGADAWRALARPAKRLRAGDALLISGALQARIEAKGQEGELLLRFDKSGPDLDAAIAAHGNMPLPPYISAKRGADALDDEDYQTTFAARPGAVAAPTAGLHFTADLLSALANAGVERTMVTLHVGAGTFLPMKVDDTNDHVMHAEWYEIGEAAAAAINTAKAEGRRVIPVGTTALRSLEAAAMTDGRVRATAEETSIFITPGYRFKICDALWTNFHLPRSTLFMLVSSLAGLDRMKAAYAHAIAEGYRFYSYGDACLIEPGQQGSLT